MKKLLIILLLLILPGASEPNVLTQLDQDIQLGELGLIDQVVIVHRGETVFTRSYPRDYRQLSAKKLKPPLGPYNYYDPDWHPYYRQSQLHSLQSITKTVTAALVGAAVLRGEIALDQDVSDFHSVELPRGITIRHLLTMTAGLEWFEETDYGQPENDWSTMERCPNWLDFVLTKPAVAQPGQKFCYNSGVPMILSAILEEATDLDLEGQARERLFQPLGIQQWHWKRSPTGEVDAQGGLYLSAADLAKIGRLHLEDGVWNRKRLLPSDWLGHTTRQSVVADGDWRFGFQWWLLPRGDGDFFIASLGYGGQRLFILPERELVVVFTGWSLVADGPGVSSTKILQRILTHF